MKINGINKIKSNVVPSAVYKKIKDGAATLGLIALAAGGAYLGNRVIEQTRQNKELVKQYNPDKYNQMLETNKSDADWNRAADAIRDSLKLDSIAKVNYVKGVQAVRDSLKKAGQ